AAFVVLASVGNGLGQRVHQVLTVIQAGEKVLATDLFQFFFEFGITVLWLQHNLGAHFTVVGRGRNRHGDAQLVIITAARGAVEGHAVFALFGKGFHEFLVLFLAFRSQRIQHRYAYEVINIIVAEKFHVGLVGIDVHAVIDVGN